MSFSDAVRTCLRKYATFSGRASRPEYWWFILFNILCSIVAGVLDGILFGAARVETGPGSIAATSQGPIAGLAGLALLLPTIAAGWRRMHDTGRSGIYLLYPFIAVLGTVSFAGFVGALDFSGPLLPGLDMPQLGALAAIILGLAFLVCVLSPLIVLWWLSRPTEPAPNRWGARPATEAAA